MDIQLIDIVRCVAALIGGGMIGLGFGTLQNAALRRNQQLERDGKFKNGWSLMPGAGTRVAYLLIALVVIQLICPILFRDGVQWWVSGGLLAGYGWHLLQSLRRRRAELK